MLFSWLKNRRRRNILAEPFPDGWRTVLDEHVGHYALLGEVEQKKLRDAVQIMLAEKDWEGYRGMILTDEMRVTVAGLAAILILGFDDFYFDNVSTVLVSPDALIVKQEHIIAGTATLMEEDDALGQTQPRGPVIVSWAEVCKNTIAQGLGGNIVFHEFAHQLDMLNGALDGTPNLPTDDLAQRWEQIMDKEYRRLQRSDRRHRETLLDPYGATDPAEFFAVAVECFFDAPRAMRQTYPPLYELFRDYFRQDPAAWRDFETHHD